MRTYVRVLGVTAAVTAAMAMGSPAFAKGSNELDNDEITAESGDSGDGGDSANVLSCLVNVAVLSPTNEQECKPSADGGANEANAEGTNSDED